MDCRDDHAGVVGDDKPVGVARVDPDVVRVAAPPDFVEAAAAVERLVERTVRDVDLVVAATRDSQPDVIAGTADQRALVVDGLPVLAGVVRSPHGPLVLRLDQCEDAARVGRCHGDVDLANRGLWQSVRLDPGPLAAAVARHVDAAAGSAAELAPGVHLDLPHAGEQGPRVVRVHRESRAADVVAGAEHALPVLAAIRRPENAAFRLGPCHATEYAREDDVGVGRMDDDSADAAGFWQAHVGPGPARVRRLVDAIAHHIAVADDPRLAGARPDDARIGRRHRECADRGDGLLVENRRPAIPAVGRFPDTAGRRPRVIDTRIAGNARDRGDAIAHFRADEPELELTLFVGVRLVGVGRQSRAQQRDGRKRTPKSSAKHGAATFD